MKGTSQFRNTDDFPRSVWSYVKSWSQRCFPAVDNKIFQLPYFSAPFQTQLGSGDVYKGEEQEWGREVLFHRENRMQRCWGWPGLVLLGSDGAWV